MDFALSQESNRELRTSKQETDTTGGSAQTPSIEMFDFKAKFAETKAHAKVGVSCCSCHCNVYNALVLRNLNYYRFLKQIIVKKNRLPPPNSKIFTL